MAARRRYKSKGLYGAEMLDLMIVMMMVVAVLPVTQLLVTLLLVTLLLMDMLKKMRKASVIQRCDKLVYTPRKKGLERQHELYKRAGDCKDHLRQKSPKTAGISLHDL